MKKMFKDGNLYILKPKTPAYDGYVKDGLVFQLDCDFVDLEGKKWTDLINNVVWTTTSNLSAGDDGGLKIASGGYFNGSIPDGYNIEIAFKASTSATKAMINCGSSLNVAFDENNSCAYGNYSWKYPVSNVMDNLTTLSFSGYGRKMYVNGVQVQEGSAQSLSYGYLLYAKGDITIYSVRVYNRILSQDEITKNAMNDRNRLNN